MNEVEKRELNNGFFFYLNFNVKFVIIDNSDVNYFFSIFSFVSIEDRSLWFNLVMKFLMEVRIVM